MGSSIEIRPGDPAVVHHVIVQVPEQPVQRGFAWGALNCARCSMLPSIIGGLQQAVLRTPDQNQDDRRPRRPGPYSSGAVERMKEVGTFTTMEAVYALGAPPLDFRFHNSAKLIRAGRQIRIEVHYTPNGKDTTDQTMIGFTLAKAPAQRRFVIMAPTHHLPIRENPSRRVHRIGKRAASLPSPRMLNWCGSCPTCIYEAKI